MLRVASLHLTSGIIEDEKWVGELTQKLFKKDPDDVTIEDMKVVGKQLKDMEVDVTHWTIGK